MSGTSHRGSAGTAFEAAVLEGAVDVWLAEVAEAADAAALARCRLALAPDEIARADAHVRERDRRRAAVSRWLLRSTLSRYAPVDPSAWRFGQGEHGRPEIAVPDAPPVRFNVSHTGDLVVCAVTLRDGIGVDVERMDEATDLIELAQTVFAPGEVASLRRESAETLARRFYERWTLKEAYLKARGLGLSLSPRHVVFDLEEPGRATVRFDPSVCDAARSWWFATTAPWPQRASSNQHVMALAWRRPHAPHRLRFFRARPGRDEATPMICPLDRASDAVARRPAAQGPQRG